MSSPSPLLTVGGVPAVQVENQPVVSLALIVNAILNLLSTVVTTVAFTSANLSISSRVLAVDINVTAVSGTTPSMTFMVDRLGADGNWYNVWTSAAITSAGAVSTDIGPGCTIPKVPTGTIRLRTSIPTGTTPSFTFTASIVGE